MQRHQRRGPHQPYASAAEAAVLGYFHDSQPIDIAPVAQFTDLQDLYLNFELDYPVYAPVSAASMAALKALAPTLQRLSVDLATGDEVECAHSFVRLAKLQALAAGGISDAGLVVLAAAQPTALTRLDLSGCVLSSEAILPLSKLPRL